jgi:Family of unknown function (DUF7009)
MKLRLKGNSIRVRMDRKDLAELLGCGRTIDVVRFGPGPARTFTYEVKLGTAPRNQPRADYIGGHLVVTINRDDAEAWLTGDRIGFDHRQLMDDGGAIRVIVEKDFACLDRPPGDEEEDAWAFPNPSSIAAC